MANAMALIDEGLWRKNREFQRLPRLAQCTFCQVLSQKDLDTAGVLTLHLDLLAKACDELTVDQLRADFAVLEQRRFLFVDYDTDELLVRSYVRRVSAKSGPKGKSLAWKSVPKHARLLGSEKLRHELAAELRRIQWREADALADEIDPLPSPPQPPSKPLPSPSENESPFEAPSKPHSQVPVLDLVSPSVVGSVGVPARPRPTCPDHGDVDSDTDCRHCGRRRRWDREHAHLTAAVDADAKRQRAELRENCKRCEGTCWVIGTEDNPVKCDHKPAPALSVIHGGAS